jgi:type II secretory pathway component GspD/PulD (secretin)
MRWASYFVLTLALAAAASAKVEKPEPLLPCPPGSSEALCNPSKPDQKEAKAAFERGLKLEHKAPEEAYAEFERAAQLVPRNVNYITARELTKQHLVSSHIERGNSDLEAGQQAEALAEFRTALKLDPGNQFAQERLRDALGDSAPKITAPPEIVEQSPEIRVAPNQNRASFHFRGDSRELLSMVGRAYGVSALVEDSVQSRRVSFDIDDVDFYKAMSAAGAVTKSFWAPLASKQIIIAPDTIENHRLYDRMAMRKFYISGAVNSAIAQNDIANVLRSLFEIRFLTSDLSTSTIVVRAPQNTVDAATELLEHLDSSRPQVMIDVHVYQVNHTLMRDIGVHIPNTFNLFNIPAGALAALGGQNIQSLINQLISSGGINQANNQALSALLAQLQGQQSSNSIFSQPLATFGGGKTLTGVSLDQLSAQLSLNESWIKTLDHASLRATQGTDATFRMGSRFPILNATFSPIFNTPSISRVIQNGSFQPAFPSFNYEDLGLTIKAKPSITASRDVGLQLEIELRALAGQSFNGVPVIGNREYKGSINLIDGEPAVIAGQVSHSETLALSGIPGLGQVPGLNKITATNSEQNEDDELLIVLTPHIITRKMGQSSEVYLAR